MILLRDLVGNFSPAELIYVAIALAGLFLATLNVREALQDFHALGGKRNGRRRIAVGTIRREILRGIVNVLLGGVGVYAGTIPANPAATLLGVLISGVFILAAAIYNLNSWLDRQDRIYLLTYGLQARDEHGRFTKGS